MTRRLTFALTFALAFAVAGSAWAGSFSNADYQGRIERDVGTYFGFDLKNSNGKTKLRKIETVVKLQCGNGEAGQVVLGMDGSLSVNQQDRFKGTLRAEPVPVMVRGGNPPTVRVGIEGKLQKHGKAKGTLDVSYDFVSGGGSRVHCYSGAVGWKAKRGAVVNPQFQMNRQGLR